MEAETRNPLSEDATDVKQCPGQLGPRRLECDLRVSGRTFHVVSRSSIRKRLKAHDDESGERLRFVSNLHKYIERSDTESSCYCFRLLFLIGTSIHTASCHFIRVVFPLFSFEHKRLVCRVYRTNALRLFTFLNPGSSSTSRSCRPVVLLLSPYNSERL